MLDLIVALKVCLGLVLLAGLITGFLYSLFAAREKYKPKVKKLEEQIHHNNTQITDLEKEYSATQEQINIEQHETSKITKKIDETEKNIQTHQETVGAIEKANQEIKALYTSTESMLHMQKERLDKLKSDIGEESVETLSQKMEEQKQTIHSLHSEIEKEDKVLNDYMEAHEKVVTEKEFIEAENENLKKRLSQLRSDLSAAEQKAITFEDELRAKIVSLGEDAKSWLAKIKIYKAKLLQLKESR